MCSHLHTSLFFQVTETAFDATSGLWTVTSATGQKVRGRVLIIADGATSKWVTCLLLCMHAGDMLAGASTHAGDTQGA